MCHDVWTEDGQKKTGRRPAQNKKKGCLSRFCHGVCYQKSKNVKKALVLQHKRASRLSRLRHGFEFHEHVKKGIGFISKLGRVTVLCVTVSSRFCVFCLVFVLSAGPFFCCPLGRLLFCPGGCFFCCCHGLTSGDMKSYKTNTKHNQFVATDYLFFAARCQAPAATCC